MYTVYVSFMQYVVQTGTEVGVTIIQHCHLSEGDT